MTEIPVPSYDDQMPEPTYGTVRVRILDRADGLIRVTARRRNVDEPPVVTWWVPAEDVDPIPPPGDRT